MDAPVESAANQPSAAPPAPRPAPVRIYRTALADVRGPIILVAFAVWVLAHAALGAWVWKQSTSARAYNLPLPDPPDAPIWFSPNDLQIGVSFFQTISASFLKSVAWQIGGILFLLAGLVVILTSRLRIFALVVPPVLFIIAAALQCIAYNTYSPYWAQGNPLFTLAFMVVCFVTTAALAPRNSGWRELRTVVRDTIRGALRNPFAQFFGPIFDKEVRVMGRRRVTYFVRAAYPLALLGLISIVYFAAMAEIRQGASGADRLQRLQEIAPMIALFLAWAQYLMLLFMAAALTAPAICDERRTRTLASLMTTPMTAAQIVMGKLTSRLAQLLILSLISAPFLLGIRVFGGLDAEAIVAIIAITISSTFLMASLGILASIWGRKPANATVLAVMLYIVLTVAPAVLAIVWSGGGPPPDEIVAFSSPLAMMAVSIQMSGGFGPVVLLDELAVANSVINVSVGLVALLLGAVCLRGVMLSETALDAPRKKVKKSKRKRVGAAAPPPAGDDSAPIEAPPEPEIHEVLVERRTVVGDNPVLWRELRQPALGSRRVMIWAAVIIAGLILWMYAEHGPQDEHPHMIVSIVGTLLILFQAAVASTPTITNEKDSSTWSTLLTTPLTAREILVPKLIGSIKKLWFIAAVIGAELLVGVFADRVRPVVFLHLAMIIGSVGVFLGGTGILLSLITRRTSAAGLLNIMLAGGLWIGAPILASIASEVIFHGGWTPFEKATFLINPIAMTVVAVEASVSGRHIWTADMPNGPDYSLLEFTAVLCVVCAIGCAVGLGSLFIATRHFNRLAGRSS